ncbi:MAG: hypothetical protein F2951_01245 [Actinobacteria bacterium]|nr:hypothetical protein [Actinomycetota bacterium]
MHSDNKGWILEKIAKRLMENLEKLGKSVEIVSEPTGHTDVVFWLYFGHSGIIQHGSSSEFQFRSALVTHVDDALKLKKVRELDKAGIDLVFMSKSHSEHISEMVRRDQIFFHVLPGTDLVHLIKPMKVGIFSKVFIDGRKNENWLIKLVEVTDPSQFEFIIVGKGWNKIVSKLRRLGSKVSLFDDIENPYPEYADFPELYNSLDLFIYLGFDEGSMGALDAFVLGTNLLVSRQGFHMEFELDDSQLFSDYAEFEERFTQQLNRYVIQQRHRQEWSWENFSKSLLDHWELEAFNRTEPRIASQSSYLHSSAHRHEIDLKVRLIFVWRAGWRFLKIRVVNWIKRTFVKHRY